MVEPVQLDLSQIDFPDVMDLRSAALFLGLSEQRVRTLAREEQIPASKTESGAWAFNKSDLETWKSTPRVRKSGGPRGEGKMYKVRVKYADLEKAKAALAEFGIELQPAYNYAKQAEYRKKRQSRLRAEKMAVAKAAKK